MFTKIEGNLKESKRKIIRIAKGKIREFKDNEIVRKA